MAHMEFTDAATKEILCRCQSCLEQADLVLEDGSYWRPLTLKEAQFGDIPRVEADFQSTEELIAKRAAPIMEKMVEQLVQEAAGLAQAKDPGSVTKLRASFIGELAAAFKKGMREGMKVGREQMVDAYTTQTGQKLAERIPRKDPKKMTSYLDAKAEVDAERVARAVEGTIQTNLLAQAARIPVADLIKDMTNPEGDFYRKAIQAGERSVMASAKMESRESVGMGRIEAWDDVKDEADYCIYSAVMDSNVCEECAAQDQREYPPDDFGQAPNDNCLGGLYGNECRCVEIVVYKRDGESARDTPVAPFPGEPTPAELAEELLAEAQKVEGQIVQDVVGFIEGQGNSMYGYSATDPDKDFHLKTLESMERKIRDNALEKGITKSEAAAEIKDAVRFTGIMNEQAFGRDVMGTMEALEQRGYTFTQVTNTLKDTGVEYRGVNCAVTTPTGYRFELQFHTEDSIYVKEALNHKLYEQARDASTSVERMMELGRIMTRNADGIQMPRGVGDIPSFRR